MKNSSNYKNKIQSDLQMSPNLTKMSNIIKKCFCISAEEKIDSPKVSQKSNSVFSDYHLDREVGKGSYGQVWLCDDKKTKHRVAIKFAAKTSKSNFYLHREFKILGLFDCDCIIKPYCLYVSEESTQMVMPFYKEDLLSYMETHHSLSDKDLKKVVKRMAKALQHSHSKNMVHRDIKPENIMFNKSFDDCVLIDWGLAKHEDAIDVSKITGSLPYLSPEMVLAVYNPGAFMLLVGKCSDMYSLGATLYAIATRKQTIEINKYADVRKIPMNDMTDRINMMDRDDDFKDILHNLLCLDPVSRMTADELLNHKYLL